MTERSEGTIGHSMRVEVLRSAKRRKTVSARQVGDDLLQVRIPARMSRAEEERWVGEMVKRFERRAAAVVDLPARASVLARRYGLPEPASIRWVDNQGARWGSCTPVDRTIRISSRLAAFPTWVVDFVVVHELAHLAEYGHGPAFKALVARYPLAERATGYLLAKGIDGDG